MSEHVFDYDLPLMASEQERAAILALVRRSKALWHLTASAIESMGSALRIINRDFSGFEDSLLRKEAEELGATVTEADLKEADAMINEMRTEGVDLLTILDGTYPLNLRRVYNRPPFLWTMGHLAPEDERSVAIVGTRKASERGLQQAGRLAAELARQGVTVLSGLARGIDTAAHEAALDAGGRTVAVMGTGIRTVYPKENLQLAERIVSQGGALVSQFWPDAPPTRMSFPMRNVVMSGMGIGTVVIEANAVSGAKMQARLALDHGKRVFLLESLVTSEEWAQRYARHRGATVVKSIDDIYGVIVEMARPAEQLTLY